MKKWLSMLLAALLALHAGAALAQSYSKGEYADGIAAMQQALTDLGLYYTSITGHFGERTEKAVRLFQKKAGLPQTGVADERTLELLALRTGMQTPAPSEGASGAISVDLVLREGSTGSAVRALQEKLKALDYYSGTVTGHYGRLTREAVRRFQRANGLTADGIAGPKTLTALGQLEAGGSAAAGGGAAAGASGDEGMLRLNSSGSAVRALQTNLQTLGYYGGTVTGTYGRLTKEAVRRFQRDNDLSADGVAGPRTFERLNALLTDGSGKETPIVTLPDSQGSDGTGTKTPLESVPMLNTEWTLRRSSRSGYVTRLQKALIALGYYTGSADGYFGSGTEDAVRAYQQARGLQVDGVAGRATLRKINSDVQSGVTAATAVID